MSGTKPMKNTMRKQPPIRFMATNAAMSATKKVSDAVAAVKTKKDATTKAPTTKTKTSTKVPPTKMKKSGMGKKC
jgi:recombination DNA repair RAD52 pathway protein